MPLLQVADLNYSINTTNIVSDFSLELSAGDIVAVLGESGSGKSTLLRLLAALEQPHAGELLLDGKRIPPPAEKLIAGHEKIKLVKQDFGLFPNVSLQENIAYELRFYEENYRDERVSKLLKWIGLSELANRLPREVSGGEQQRAVIARALADEPRLLLLDEPFSHLDLRNKQRLKADIWTMIDEEQSGCIFVTHDVSDAFGIANKTMVIRAGETLQVGTPTELYECPKSVYTAELTGICNFLSDTEINSLQHTNFQTNNTVLIRPEWISEATNGWSGRVKSATFLGHFYQYEIEANGLALKWLSFKHFFVGDEVTLTVTKFWEIKA